MLMVLSRERFESMEHRLLGWACVEPLLQELKRERIQVLQESPERMDGPSGHVEVKSAFYGELTPGQQALLMFWVVENHWCKGMPEFYWWSVYFRVQEKVWAALKKGLHLFQDTAMIALLEEVEHVLEARNRVAAWPDVSPRDLDADPELCTTITRMCETYQTITPNTHRLIGSYIQNHPNEFLRIEPEERTGDDPCR